MISESWTLGKRGRAGRLPARLTLARGIRRLGLYGAPDCRASRKLHSISKTGQGEQQMQNKNLVVVGGSHGIGLGIVQQAMARGAEVTVVSRSSGQLAATAGIRHIIADVTDDEVDASALPESIDGFAYCPGSINLGPLRSVEAGRIRQDFELNVVGAVKWFQAVAPALRRSDGASAVFFSTVAVAQGMPMHTSVAAAKGAIEGLTRTWAAELSPQVRVNCVAPALTATPLSERFLETEEKRAAMASKYPLRRVGEIDDIAGTALFLLSEQSSWMTGQVLAVDGGMSSVRK